MINRLPNPGESPLYIVTPQNNSNNEAEWPS